MSKFTREEVLEVVTLLDIHGAGKDAEMLREYVAAIDEIADLRRQLAAEQEAHKATSRQANEAIETANASVAAANERKDGAYLERNQVVAALAKCFPSGIARTAIEGWSEDWHGCVYIDLPTGQVSWHYHDSQAYLFAGLPPYSGKGDGHDTPTKYERVSALKDANEHISLAVAMAVMEVATKLQGMVNDADYGIFRDAIKEAQAILEGMAGADTLAKLEALEKDTAAVVIAAKNVLSHCDTEPEGESRFEQDTILLRQAIAKFDAAIAASAGKGE